MYLQGLATGVDIDRARELFKLAARRGEFFACIDLARLEVSLQCDDEASRWYQLAAEQAERITPWDELDEALAFLAARRAPPSA